MCFSVSSWLSASFLGFKKYSKSRWKLSPNGIREEEYMLVKPATLWRNIGYHGLRLLGGCYRSRQGKLFIRTFGGWVLGVPSRILSLSFLCILFLWRRKQFIKISKNNIVNNPSFRWARGMMPVAHLEGTDAPSFPENELGNCKKTQPSHHLMA